MSDNNCVLNTPYPPIKTSCRNLHYAALLSEVFAGQLSEVTAVNQYLFQHFVSCDQQVGDTMKCVAKVEMHHMDILGELITQLGGCPKLAAQSGCNNRFWNGQFLCYDTNPVCFLKNNIAAEKAAIAAYTSLIDRICDDDIRQILERIIKDEEHHIKIFTELLEGLSSNNCCR